MRLTAVRTWAQALMWILVTAYLGLLLLHGTGFEPLVDGWLCVLTQLAPAVVCWLAVPSAAGRRAEVGWLAFGVSAFAGGNAILVVAEVERITLPVPSLADVGYLAFYPAVLVALVLAA